MDAHTQMEKLLFLESFYGGSHEEFSKGLCHHSRFDFDLYTMSMRFWKWRMRGSALHFSKKVKDPQSYGGMVVTDLISLADLKALWGADCPLALLYFHESQLTYPLPAGENFDVQYGFTEMSSALCADRILFNSRFHMELFFEKLRDLLKMMPDYRPNWVVDEIRGRADVLYPGVELDREGVKPKSIAPGPPLVIWNHRWEFDKCPEVFFRALRSLKKEGIAFRLAVLGQNFQVQPDVFLEARKEFQEEILHFGYAKSRAEYLSWLSAGDLVISCAIQENFGISVVEAIYHGCFPILPNRLAYPELLDEESRRICLYDHNKELRPKIRDFLLNPLKYKKIRSSLGERMQRFSWKAQVSQYDQEIQNLFSKPIS